MKDFKVCTDPEFEKLTKQGIKYFKEYRFHLFDNICSLENIHFERCIFENINFTYVNRCVFDDCKFYNCTFKMTMHWNYVSSSSFRNCSFSGLRLTDIIFKNSKFYNTDFSKTNFVGCVITDCTIKNCETKNAFIDNDTYFITNNFINNLDENIKFDISMACPDTGSFIGWKKAYYINSHGNTENCIIKLEIPEDAKRLSGTSKKCRCNKAKVLEIQTLNGEVIDTIAYSYYLLNARKTNNANFTYQAGITLYINDFNENRFAECSPGIHFFINRCDAVNYEP